MIFQRIANTLFPRLCCGCGKRLAIGETLVCATCQMLLPLETKHDWRFNSRRLAWNEHEALLHVGAFTRYERGNIASEIVRSLKFHQRHELGLWMGRVAVEQLRDTGLFVGVDMLVPIPLTNSRRRLRGFNQAEMIARGMSAASGIPVRTDILLRRYNRESQTHFSIPQRIENGRNLFALQPHADVRGMHVMLVDDVMTTGTTLLGAIEALETIPDVTLSTFAWAWTHTPPVRNTY